LLDRAADLFFQNAAPIFIARESPPGYRMAVMRPLALSGHGVLRILNARCCTGSILPESVGGQHVPLWKLPVPTPAKLKPGPKRARFFFCVHLAQWIRRAPPEGKLRSAFAAGQKQPPALFSLH
jgi:hypothetical protein